MSFLNKYFKNNENWLLVLKTNARRGLLALGSNGKIVFAPEGGGVEKLDHPLLKQNFKTLKVNMSDWCIIRGSNLRRIGSSSFFFAF
jgi:hypothetical protein